MENVLKDCTNVSKRDENRQISIPSERWICDLCSKSFKSKKNLTKHKRSIHERNGGTSNNSCSKCSQSFASVAKLNVHLAKQHNVKLFACQHCDKRFHRKEALERHTNTHTGHRPFVCECGSSFKESGNFAKHKKLHKPGHVRRSCKPYLVSQSAYDRLVQEALKNRPRVEESKKNGTLGKESLQNRSLGDEFIGNIETTGNSEGQTYCDVENCDIAQGVGIGNIDSLLIQPPYQPLTAEECSQAALFTYYVINNADSINVLPEATNDMLDFSNVLPDSNNAMETFPQENIALQSNLDQSPIVENLRTEFTEHYLAVNTEHHETEDVSNSEHYREDFAQSQTVDFLFAENLSNLVENQHTEKVCENNQKYPTQPEESATTLSEYVETPTGHIPPKEHMENVFSENFALLQENLLCDENLRLCENNYFSLRQPADTFSLTDNDAILFNDFEDFSDESGMLDTESNFGGFDTRFDDFLLSNDNPLFL